MICAGSLICWNRALPFHINVIDVITQTQYLFILFIYLGFYVAFNTVQVISRWVVGRAEETSTYSSLGLCTVNCRPTASNYQLSHLRPSWGSNPGLRGGRRECYHSATMAPRKPNKLYSKGSSLISRKARLILTLYSLHPLPRAFTC